MIHVVVLTSNSNLLWVAAERKIAFDLFFISNSFKYIYRAKSVKYNINTPRFDCRERIIKEQKNMNNFDDNKIPEEDENLGQVELQNGVDIKEKTQPNGTENKVSDEGTEMDVSNKVEEDIEEVDVKEVERLAEEIETERKSFPNEKEKLIEIAEKAKIVDIEKTESLEKEDIVHDTYETKEVAVDDKGSLITNDKVDSEAHENSVPTI
jgi:hypothetical protein